MASGESTLITAEMTVENLVDRYPHAVGYLVREGIPCLVCGEGAWGTVAEENARGKTGEEPGRILMELNAHVAGEQA